MDKYANFAELSGCEGLDVDYQVHVRTGNTRYAIVAPHGGYIERGTRQLADAIAGDEHGFYCFEAIHKRAAQRLHVTSDNFDEPKAFAAAATVDTVLSVHGARGNQAAAYFGGLDFALRTLMIERLRRAGIEAADDPSPTRQGRGASNICNRGRSGKGVQLELTVGMRKALFRRLPDDRWEPNSLFATFVGTLREVLAEDNLPLTPTPLPKERG